mgnify:CR=1 FL=1
MESQPWEDELTASIKARFPDGIVECAQYRDQKFVVAKPEAAIPLLTFLRDEAAFDYLVDETAVHWPKRDAAQFDLIYILYSFAKNERVRVKVKCPEGYKPETAVPIYATANWLEREVFDMFGIEFAGHPDLRRILMPAEFTAFPLRKDYPMRGRGERHNFTPLVRSES